MSTTSLQVGSMAAPSALKRLQHPGGRLFLLAFLTLYLELAFIRFTAAEVLYLGYFANFVLISVFLGIGTGFLLADRSVDLFRFVPPLILLLIVFVVTTHIDATVLRDHLGQLFFGQGGTASRLPLWLALPFIFLSFSILFACISQETGRSFKPFAPLVAYTLDILGSLTGIVVFTLQSIFERPATEWFAIGMLGVLFLSRGWWRLTAAVCGIAVVWTVTASAPSHYTRWSPYQRVEVWPIRPDDPSHGYHLAANGIGHQTMQPTGTKEAFYDFPYTELLELRHGKKYARVLIIGAGSGTDVAYALKHGASHVDAVEIDPVIQRAGVRFHPDRPYQDPRVSVHLTDGRAFMERAHETYDMVIYALPDSIATLSNFANIRLESFLFTEESFAQAATLLEPDGVLVLYNYYRRDWLINKLAHQLERVFGRAPYQKSYGESVAALAIGPTIEGNLSTQRITPATDTWPFLYMERPALPAMYLFIMYLFVSAGVVSIWLTGHADRRSALVHVPFALMGAAFFLLETKSVIAFSLLFGATWVVNSLVFFAILCSVLVANLIVARWTVQRPWPLFAILLAVLAVQYLVPLRLLLDIENFSLRYVVTSAMLFAPVFVANLVFSSFFKDTAQSAAAFGWNITGTMIGAALEYTSMAIGYRNLTLIVLVLYASCFWWARRSRLGPRVTDPRAPIPARQ